MIWPILAAFLLGAVLWRWRAGSGRAKRRRSLLAGVLPENVTDVLRTTVPGYSRLAPSLRKSLDARVAVFLAEKTFVGCKDVVVSDELRFAIAGNACLLLAGRTDDWVYDDLSEVLVHPLTWRREESVSLGDGLEIKAPWSSFDGESWLRGPVVLSRGAVRRSLRELDGYNVILHEFAHQLDAENGAMEGCPALPKSLQAPWARVMSMEFERLVKADADGSETFLDPYGAEHPSEFYAVLVEAFLEIPEQLREQHPELFQLLARAFGFDPATGQVVGVD